MPTAKYRVATVLHQTKAWKDKPANKRVRGYRLYKGAQFLKMYKVKADAMKAKAKALAAELSGARPGCRPKPATRHMGVFARQLAGGEWTFDARCKVPGQKSPYIGTRSSPKEAAKLVADRSQRTVDEIKLAKTSVATPQESASRFQVLTELFDGWVPADIQSAVRLREGAGLMPAAAPGIYVGALLGKEERWRQCVLGTWFAMSPTRQLQVAGLESHDDAGQKEAAFVMHSVFADSLTAYAGNGMTAPERKTHDDERAFWSLHVNRNVSHHHSLIPWAVNYKLVKKQARQRGRAALRNKEGVWFGLTRFDAKIHVPLMWKLHKLGRATQCTTVPKTNAEWLNEFRFAKERASQNQLSHEGYHWNWLVRTRLWVEMRRAGIKRLKVTDDWGSEQVAEAMLPDQSEWLSCWMTEFTKDSLKGLLMKLNYKGPLEMLSCFACVLGDNALQDVSAEQLKKYRRQIKDVRAATCQKYGMEGCPALIVGMALRDAVEGVA